MGGQFTSGGVTAIAITVFVDIIGTFSTILRFVAKSKTGDPIHKDDVCAVVAWFFSIGMSINLGLEIHWAFRLGNDSNQDFAVDFKNFLLVNYVVEPTYTLSIGFTKLSIIFLYLRLFGTLNWMQSGCKLALALVVAWTVAFTVVGLVQCVPVRKAWDLGILEGGCIDITIFFICQRATNLITDLILLGLPVKVVVGLNASLAKRMSLLFGFAMGGLVCIATAYTLALTVSILGREVSFDDYRSLLWTVVELEIGVLCANMPSCYSFVVRIVPESWRNKVAERVDTMAHTRRGNRSKQRGTAEQSDTPKNPSQPKSRGVMSWAKGGTVVSEPVAYALDDVERMSTNSDAEMLRERNGGAIYVRRDFEVVDTDEGQRAGAKCGW